MTDRPSKRPNPGRMLMILGAFYVAYAGFAFLMSSFQLWIRHTVPVEPGSDPGGLVLRIHQVWRFHLSWMIGLGCLYVLFGWRLPKLERAKYVIHWVLLALCLAVAISYVVHVLPVSKAFSQTMPMPALRTFSYATSVVGAVMCLVMAVAPQLGILWLMKKKE